MSQPTLAFVGDLDSVSPWLLRSISACGTFEGICADGGESAASGFHVRWTFADVDTLLKETEPNGVILAVPVANRAKTIKHCLAAGAGVLIPGVPGQASACKRLSTLAKLSGRVVLAASPIRYSPAVGLARRLLDSGQFGAPVSMTVHSTGRSHRRSEPGDDGPVSIDQIFEAVDLIQHLIGPIERVFAVSHDDGATVATASTAAGVPVSLVLHPCGPAESVGIRIEMRAIDGDRLEIDGDGRMLCGGGSKIHASRRGALATTDPAVELGDHGLIAEFVRCLEASRSGPGLIGPAASVSATAEALLASIGAGRPIVPKPAQKTSKTTAKRTLELA
ncbi:MAG: hypothetical protein O7B26_05035 [Planctomycetota bacterium]|nr:hypothetical protein [Planctomycetota bacterium]